MDTDDSARVRLGAQDRHFMAALVGGIVGRSGYGGDVGWDGWFYPLH